MAEKLRLTVACGDYEIVRALKEGAVKADGLELVVLTGMGPRERHWRMARKAEFDVCEGNVGAYFMERDHAALASEASGQRGNSIVRAPLTAIPVFLHRRFRHGFLFVNADAGIREPKDLIGKKVGGTNFQPASNIWMRGILEEEYGLPHRQVTWVVERSEDVEFTPPKDLRIEMIAPGKKLDEMLAEGEISAMLSPDLPQAVRQRRQAHRADVSELQGHRARLFPQDRHLPDHARHHDQAGDRRQISLGADQPGEGVRGGEADRLPAHRQSAHGAARLGAHGGRGAGAGARARSLGLRARRRPTARTSRRCCATPTSRA